MRRLAVLAVVVALMSPTITSGQDYSFGDWARDQGYSAGDVMPGEVHANGSSPAIDSLDGIGDFDWTTTPTTQLRLYGNQISSIESSDFSGLANLTELYLYANQLSSIESGALSGLANLTLLLLGGNRLSSIESGDFSGLTNLETLDLNSNQLSSIESGAFSGLTNLTQLELRGNIDMTELNLAEADFSRLREFSVRNNANITSVSLKNTAMNQESLAALLDGGGTWQIGIGELGDIDGTAVTEMDLSSVDFADITDLSPLYVMDDLTNLLLVDTQNLDATELDVLLDNLETIEGTDTEGILHMTQANFDAFNTAGGGLLAAWDAEPGHHVVIPEPSTLLLGLLALGVVGGWWKWKHA